MPLFNRNPNESAFVGGKKNWAYIIKNSGGGNLLIWRQPGDGFNKISGEKAVFIKNRVIEQTFDSRLNGKTLNEILKSQTNEPTNVCV